MTARHFEWSPDAVLDLKRLHEFLRPKSPRTADKAIATIRASLEVLLTFPDAGRVAEDSGIDHRELIVPFSRSGYVVTYKVHDEAIEIIDIRHQREAGY